MKLTQNIINMTARNAAEFVVLKERFDVFVEQVEAIGRDKPRLGIKVSKSDTQLSFGVEFAATHIRFQAFPAYDDDHHLIGKIFVTRQSHRLFSTEEVLGVVTFDRFGLSDIEDTGPNDCFTLTACAEGIIGHFLHLAIGRPVIQAK